ncbi:MAG: dockerin type I domain-containing protein [Chloroflexota bacterium]
MKAKLIFSIVTIVTLVSLLIGALPAQAAGNTWIVKSTFADDENCTAAKRLCKTIQGAVDGASPGDIIRIYPGEYSAPVNIENKSNITLMGFGSSRTILKPATVLPWNIGGYGSTRTVAIRLVNSTNITINGIKLDMALVKGNNVSGMLLWDSTGALQQSVLINNQVSDASGGYYEMGIRIRTESSTYNASNRAVFTVTDSLFQDVGRVGINAHDWSHVVIRRSVFMKSAGANDFGYGVEIGSESTADIQQTKFYGFNTPAASESSASGGLYIEAAFTGPLYDPNYAIQKDKNVIVKYCEMYDNQLGLIIANDWDKYTGNVDMNIQVVGNYIHDNEYGVVIADEDKQYGSSVTVNASNNIITNNDYGYDIYTYGDGEIHANLIQEVITNNTEKGVLVEYVNTIGTSIYDVHLTRSNISGNGVGVEAFTGITVDAALNWWGSDAGPGAGGNNGVAGGGSVTTTPFAEALAAGVTGSTHEVGETGTLDSNITVNGLYGAQLHVNHDASVLSFVSGAAHDVSSTPPWAWDHVVENFIATASGRRLSGTMTNEFHPEGADLTGQSIATWTYQCNAPGGSNLTYDMTAGTGTILANKDGFAIPAALTGGVILCEPQTASVSGTIKLQGRLGTNPSPAGWNDAYVTLTCVSGTCSGYGPYTTVTDSTGHYEWVKSGPGTGIPLGTYSVSVVRRAYLGAVKSSDVTIVAGSNTITPAPTLLGGDVNGDETISIADLSGIGGVFGSSVTPDTGMDVNGDGVVNVLDLVLAGGNFDLSSPQGW